MLVTTGALFGIGVHPAECFFGGKLGNSSLPIGRLVGAAEEEEGEAGKVCVVLVGGAGAGGCVTHGVAPTAPLPARLGLTMGLGRTDEAEDEGE